jgi:hypothetical protein
MEQRPRFNRAAGCDALNFMIESDVSEQAAAAQSTLLCLNAGTAKTAAKGLTWASLRFVRKPPERFSASPGRTGLNDNHKESDLGRTTLDSDRWFHRCERYSIAALIR